MPLEIRELSIKVSVGQSTGQNQQNAPQNGNGDEKKQAEINMIIEKVLSILKEKQER